MNQYHSSLAIPTIDIFEEVFAELKQQEKLEQKMVLSQKHAEEIFWLNRRIEFLTKINKLIANNDSPEEVTLLKNEYNKVAEPNDIISRLKEIYADDLNDRD